MLLCVLQACSFQSSLQSMNTVHLCKTITYDLLLKNYSSVYLMVFISYLLILGFPSNNALYTGVRSATVAFSFSRQPFLFVKMYTVLLTIYFI